MINAISASPTGIKYAAAVAEVRRRSTTQMPFQVRPSKLDAETERMITSNFGTRNGVFVQSIFRPESDLKTEGGDTAGFLGWVGAACGLAAGKKVRVHVHVGEFPQAGNPVEKRQEYQVRADDLKKLDALLFINYTASGGTTEASFAIAKPKGMFSTEVVPTVEWTVFCPKESTGRFDPMLQHIVGTADCPILHMLATYDSLEALVTDILAHLMFNGRPAPNALWSGSEIRKGLALAGLYDPDIVRVSVTTTMLNAALAAKTKRVQAFVNPGAPPDLPPHMSDAEYISMYNPFAGQQQQVGDDAKNIEKRQNKTVWATSAVKTVQNLEKVLGERTSYMSWSRPVVSWMKMFSGNSKATRVGRRGANVVFTNQTTLQDLANTVLGMSMNIDVKDDTTVPDPILNAWNNLYDQINTDKAAIPAGVATLIGDILAGTFFYSLFLHFVDKKSPLATTANDFFNDGSLSNFLPEAVIFCIDQFVDFTMAETRLLQLLSGQIAKVLPPGEYSGLSLIISRAVDFISANTAVLGVMKDDKNFLSLETLFENEDDAIDRNVVARNVLRCVTVGALLDFMAASAKEKVPLFKMSWPTSRQPDLVSRIVHFFRPNKINGGRRGTTAAEAALKVLYKFMKVEEPSVKSITDQFNVGAPVAWSPSIAAQPGVSALNQMFQQQQPVSPFQSPAANGSQTPSSSGGNANQTASYTPGGSSKTRVISFGSPKPDEVQYFPPPDNLAQSLGPSTPQMVLLTPQNDKEKGLEMLSEVIGAFGDVENILKQYKELLELKDKEALFKKAAQLRGAGLASLKDSISNFSKNLDTLEKIEKFFE